MKRFERSNGLDTALYKNDFFFFYFIYIPDNMLYALINVQSSRFFHTPSV